MKRIMIVATLAAALTATLALPATAQTAQRTTPHAGHAAQATVANTLAALPVSDAVAAVDVQRLFREALPRVFANEPAKLAEVNADIEQFKTRTGLDPRTFEHVALGVQFEQTPRGGVKLASVGIARGAFNPAALVAAGRIAARGQYEEQQYKGKTIYVFSLDRQVKFLHLRWTDLAVVALDNKTLAFGQPARVRAAVDSMTNGRHVSSEVVALALRDPNAIIGMGGNVPASLLGKLDFLNPEISRAIASIRQFYGSFGADANGFQLATTLRTGGATEAKTLVDTVEGLRQLAPFALSRLTGDKAKLAQQLVDDTKVTTEGGDVQVRLTLADANVATLVRVF